METLRLLSHHVRHERVLRRDAQRLVHVRRNRKRKTSIGFLAPFSPIDTARHRCRVISRHTDQYVQDPRICERVPSAVEVIAEYCQRGVFP